MSPAATAWLLHAMAPVPVHHATHAAYRVPANIDNALLGTGGSSRNWAERRCRSRRSQGGSERGQQSRGDHRYAQGTFPLVRPPEQWRLAKAQPPSDGSGVEITKGSGLNVAGASAAMAGTHEHPRPLGESSGGLIKRAWRSATHPERQPCQPYSRTGKCETVSHNGNGFRFAEPVLSTHARPPMNLGGLRGQAWRSVG